MQNENVRAEIVNQFREVRKRLGITQQVLADMTGTKKSNISRFESGRYNPSLDFLIKLATGLGIEIHFSIQ